MLSRAIRKFLIDHISLQHYRQPIVLLGLIAVFGFPSITSTTFKVTSSCIAQSQPAQDALQTDDESAMKYHSALLERPTSGYLYDRFYNAWLESSTLKELEQFLVERADTPQAENSERLLLAFFYAKQSQDAKALKQFRLALQNNPHDFTTLYEMAIIQARTLDNKSALKSLNQTAKANPSAEEKTKIALLRSKLLVRNRQTEAAEKVWDKLFEDNPKNLGLMEDLIELQISERLFKQAKATSDKLIALTKDPLQKVIYTLRKGDILQDNGSRAEALEVYENTLAKVGVDSWLERDILGRVERLFRREDNLTGLNKYLAKLTESNQQRVAVRKNQAKVLIELGQVDGAIKVHENIIELTPGSRLNKEAFADLLINANRNDRAAKLLESLAAEYPKDAELQIQLAELCHKISAQKRAKAALDKFISLSSNSEGSYLRAAMLFEKFGDFNNARGAYQTALQKFPSSSSLKEFWADFLFRSDSTEEAVQVWQSLAEGTDRDGLVRLARLISNRKLNQVAFDMLHARYEDFKLDSIYLGQLCNEAILLKKFSPLAVSWATDRVRLAETSGDVESVLQQAIQIIDAANANEAVVQRLRDKKDRNVAEICLLVELLERSAQADEAESLVRTSFEASKTANQNQDAQILAWQRVRLAKRRRDWTGAAAAAQEAFDLPGGRKRFNAQQLVELYARTGDHKSALKWIPEWKRLAQGSLLPWLKEASLLFSDGKTNESVAVLQAATQKFPDDPNLLEQLAAKYLSTGQTKDAKRIFWRLYEDSEKLSDKIRWAAKLDSVARMDNTTDLLVKQFEERRQNNPQSVAPLLSLIQVYRPQGDSEEHRNVLLELSKLKQDDLTVLFEIARLEESGNDWRAAIKTLEQASLLDKTNRTKQKIAQVYLNNGKTEEGLAMLLEIADAANSSAVDFEQAFSSIADNGKFQELVDLSAPILQRFPDNYRIGYLVAIAHEELNNIDVAKSQFLKLFRIDHKTPTGSVQNTTSWNRVSPLTQVLPQSAIDLEDLLWTLPYFAYHHKNAPKRGWPPTVQLPSDLESCQKDSLCHLVEIARRLPQSERAGLQEQLESLGIEDFKILMAKPKHDHFREDPRILFRRDPDSKAALALAVVKTRKGRLQEATCLKAIDTFKESSPALSLLAISKLDQTKPQNEEHLTEAVERLKTMQEPDWPLFTVISSVARSSLKDSQHRQALHQVLLDWYPKFSTNPLTSWKAFDKITSCFRDNELLLIEILNQELDKIKKQRARQPSSFRYSNNRFTSTVSLLPYFPPTNLFSLPEYVQRKLPGSPSSFEVANAAKDPVMKALIQLNFLRKQDRLNSKENAAQMPDRKWVIDQLLESTPTNIDAWYLAGALAVSEKRWDDAATSFEQMSRLPAAAKIRNRMDSYLIGLATQGVLENDNLDDLKIQTDEKVVTSAKAAALRVRHDKLLQRQRIELVYVFELLGLDEEIESLEREITLATNAGERVVAMPIDQTFSTFALLKRAGKTTAATRLLTQQFRNIARDELNLNTMNQQTRFLKDFKERVKNSGWENQLVAELKPGEHANARKLAVWAFALETFGDQEASKKLYRKILQDTPQDHAVFLRYLSLNPNNAVELFNLQFPTVQRQSRVRYLILMLDQMKKCSIKTQLSLTEAVINYRGGDYGDLSSDLAMNMLDVIANVTNQINKDDKLPSIYTKPNQNKSIDSKSLPRLEGLKMLADRRRVLHDRIAWGLSESRVPGQTAKAFTALWGAAEAAGQPADDAMVALALKAVYPIQNLSANSNVRFHRRTSLPDQVIPRTPLEFLARHYGLSDVAHDEKIEVIAKQLEALGAKNDAAALRETYRLYRTTGDQFMDAANKLIRSASRYQRVRNRWEKDIHEWGEALKRVEEVRKERDLAADTSELWIDYLTRETEERVERLLIVTDIPHRSCQAAVPYLQAFAEENELSVIEGLVMRIKRRLLGTDEQQLNFIKSLVTQRTTKKDKEKLIRLGTYLRVLELLNSRKTLLYSLKEMQRLKIRLRDPEAGSYLVPTLIEEFRADEVDSLLVWLEELGFLADLKDFDPISWPRRDISVWGSVLAKLKDEKEIMPEIAKKLAKKANRTFGEFVLLSFAEERPVNIYLLLRRNSAVIQSLPQVQQMQLRKFAREVDQINFTPAGKIKQ